MLIQGASGTGKELFAQSIHNYSERSKEPFVAINCASIPKEVMESELFGYEKGVFTGASKDGQMGKFELAEGGTIFIDEIGEMPLDMPSKLLRVLDNKKICRIGGTYEKKLNVRIITATNRNLFNEVIVVLQRKSIRQEYAKRAGADIVLDPNEVDIVSEIIKLTDGVGTLTGPDKKQQVKILVTPDNSLL